VFGVVINQFADIRGEFMGKSHLLALAPLILLGACSTVMEANRPSAVNISKYNLGQKRLDVVSSLGAPINTVKDAGNSCDVYKLYTKGTSKAGKAGIIFTEAAADFFTLGLAEAVATPAEAATKSNLHTVLICYDTDERLVSLRDEGRVVQGAIDAHPVATPDVAAATAASAPPPTAAKPATSIP
jgi:hypothetical protein